MVLRLSPFAPFLAATAIRAVSSIALTETAVPSGVGGSDNVGAGSAGVTAIAVTSGGDGEHQGEPHDADPPPALLTQP